MQYPNLSIIFDQLNWNGVNNNMYLDARLRLPRVLFCELQGTVNDRCLTLR